MAHPEEVPDTPISVELAVLDLELARSNEQIMFSAVKDKCPPDSWFAIGTLRNGHDRIGRVTLLHSPYEGDNIDILHRDHQAPVPGAMHFVHEEITDEYRVSTPTICPEDILRPLKTSNFLKWLDTVEIVWVIK